MASAAAVIGVEQVRSYWANVDGRIVSGWEVAIEWDHDGSPTRWRPLCNHEAEDERLLWSLGLTWPAPAYAGARPSSLANVEREIARARGANRPLLVAYVQVVGVNAVRNSDGDVPADALVGRTVRAIRGRLRSYDLIVRLSDEAFLCVMAGATIRATCQRFAEVQTALTEDADRCEIRVGFAALAREDTAAELLECAVAQMPPRASSR